MTEQKQPTAENDEFERKMEEVLGSKDLGKECEAEDRKLKEAMEKLLGLRD